MHMVVSNVEKDHLVRTNSPQIQMKTIEHRAKSSPNLNQIKIYANSYIFRRLRIVSRNNACTQLHKWICIVDRTKSDNVVERQLGLIMQRAKRRFQNSVLVFTFLYNILSGCGLMEKWSNEGGEVTGSVLGEVKSFSSGCY